MTKLIQWSASFAALLITSLTYAGNLYAKNLLEADRQHVLSYYIKQPEPIRRPIIFQSVEYDAKQKVTKQTYTLRSQVWPKDDTKSSHRLWQHTLIIYRPDKVTANTAFLFINGGARFADGDVKGLVPSQLNFTRMAAETHSIVVDLQDVPNEYLTFTDGIPRKEDGIIAYTWNKYMDDPRANQFWPGHLPMVKSVVKAMDAVQQTLARENNIHIKHFVLSGASKRGWTTWLTALADHRVSAIVPIVIDILNTKKNIDLIYESYHDWPIAFHDYVEQKITDRFQSDEFSKLLDIEDPIQYLNCGKLCSDFKKRLAMPKYIISASGDDFFVPDSLSVYLDLLPGENLTRTLPNQSHFIDFNIVENDLLSFYRTILDGSVRPHIAWQMNAAKVYNKVTAFGKVLNVTLWEAYNATAHDFRFNSHIRYHETKLAGVCHGEQCDYEVNIAKPAVGFKAAFVEVIFQKANGEVLTLTTPAVVLGA